MVFLRLAKQIGERLRKIPKIWDGREAILEMRDANYPHWRQMEWIGFYFQFLCEKYLSNFMEIPGLRYENTKFDGFKDILWDFKTHVINTNKYKIIVNDSKTIAEAIDDFDSVGLIIAFGEAIYDDESRSFQNWHNALKGGLSKYTIKRIERGSWSRIRKVYFELKQINFVEINDDVLIRSGTFQSNFRNSNGLPRKEKVLLDLNEIDEGTIYSIKF